MSRNRAVLTAAFTAAVIGAGGLAALAIPAGAGEQPSLPSVSAEELVSSALAATPPAMNGTVSIENALGVPALPGLPQLGGGDSTVRVWSDGGERSRVSMPSSHGEWLLVDDGAALWAWDSSTRTATKLSAPPSPGSSDEPDSPGVSPRHGAFDPATVARILLSAVRPSSTIDVDGTAEVAGRPAYELTLAPAPTERTLLREIRVAVDAQTRVPLRLMVLGHGSAEPVLSIGFTELTVGPQDEGLFRFTPPAGANVTETTPGKAESPASWLTEPELVGDGWDIVVVTELPEGVLGGSASPGPESDRGRFDKPQRDVDPQAMLERLGTPVGGPWGSGRLITTAVASAIVTSDGRVAVGAVPQQVLVEALSR